MPPAGPGSHRYPGEAGVAAPAAHAANRERPAKLRAAAPAACPALLPPREAPRPSRPPRRGPETCALLGVPSRATPEISPADHSLAGLAAGCENGAGRERNRQWKLRRMLLGRSPDSSQERA